MAVVEPGELKEQLDHLDPEIVLCGWPETKATSGKTTWVEFRPYAEPSARIHLNGQYSELSEVDLDDLLWVVDETRKLSRMSGS